MRLCSILILGPLFSSAAASTASRRPVREPAIDVTSCDHVAAAIVRLMAQDDPVATPARIQPLLTRRCVADRWTHAARACIVAAKSEAAADACEALLSKVQTARVREDVEKLHRCGTERSDEWPAFGDDPNGCGFLVCRALNQYARLGREGEEGISHVARGTSSAMAY